MGEHVRTHKGNVTHLLECIMLSNAEDADRFIEIVQAAFRTGLLPSEFEAKFRTTTGAMRRNGQRQTMERPKKRSRAGASKDGGLESLALTIRERSTSGARAPAFLRVDLPDDPLAGKDLDEIRRQNRAAEKNAQTASQ